MVRQQSLSRAELLALPAVVPLWPDAARAVGVGRSRAYEMVRSGEWPTRVLRLGSMIRVPSAELLALLGIEQQAPSGGRPDGGGAAA
jgi:predicted DNA-binding transcriptional regulator AlpA